MFFCSLIRSTLEYASTVFSGLPTHLEEAIERVQKRGLKIIFPDISYDQALLKANINKLTTRRHEACVKFIKNITPQNPLYKLVASRVNCNAKRRSQRLGTSNRQFNPTKTLRFHNFVTNRYALDLSYVN